ncbi:hypothetical protein CLOP_g24975, partial [Closterium sp. NIES-67]
GAIALAKNPVLHGLTKHMKVKWHWVRSMPGNLAADVPGGAEGVRAAVLAEIYEVARGWGCLL